MRFPGFIGPSYTLQSVNVDCQRCINLFPEINQLGTGKEQEVAALVPTPGLRLLVNISDDPIRGEWRASNGNLFIAAGQKFYSISSSWVATERGSLNTSTGPVSMADNGTYVFIVDGSSGYTWNIDTNTFAQVVDPNFLPSDQVKYLDGYFIFNQKDSKNCFFSDLNAVTFDALDVFSAEGSPDDVIGIEVMNQNIYVFGSQSTEVFYNTGDSDNTFQRIQGAVISVGCVAPFSIHRLQNSVLWLGGDETGNGVIYKSEGYQAVRISTPAIESTIRALTADQIAAATAYTYQQGGHIFYCLNIPGSNTTWVFDGSTSLWHERAYLNLWSLERHRAECHAVAYGENVVGDYQNGKLYALDLETDNDNGISIARERTAPHISKGLANLFHSSFQLDMETGVGTDGTGQGNDPKAVLTWSDDGGHTWSNERWASIGKIGKTKTRVIWRRLGRSRDRVYKVRITDPVKVVLIGADIQFMEGAA